MEEREIRWAPDSMAIRRAAKAEAADAMAFGTKERKLLRGGGWLLAAMQMERWSRAEARRTILLCLYINEKLGLRDWVCLHTSDAKSRMAG